MNAADVKRIDLRDADARVQVGEVFEVSVPTAISSGLSLAVELPEKVRLVSKRGETSKRFGGRGRAIFRFECREPGDFAIAFRQSRPWSDESRVSTLCVHCAR